MGIDRLVQLFGSFAFPEVLLRVVPLYPILQPGAYFQNHAVDTVDYKKTNSILAEITAFVTFSNVFLIAYILYMTRMHFHIWRKSKIYEALYIKERQLIKRFTE